MRVISIALYRFAQALSYVLPESIWEPVTYPIDRLRWWFEKHAPVV